MSSRSKYYQNPNMPLMNTNIRSITPNSIPNRNRYNNEYRAYSPINVRKNSINHLTYSKYTLKVI